MFAFVSHLSNSNGAIFDLHTININIKLPLKQKSNIEINCTVAQEADSVENKNLKRVASKQMCLIYPGLYKSIRYNEPIKIGTKNN